MDRYFIHPHIDASSKPLILVPALEVEALLYDINKDFGTSYKMPHPNKEPGFLLNFDEKGCPRPRYLGRVDVDISVEDMESKIPAPGFKANGEAEVPEDRSFAAFKAKMEAAIQAGKNKTKSQKERKKKDRIVSKQIWCDQLKRTQCYLGLRPRCGLVAKNVSDMVGSKLGSRALSRPWMAETVQKPFEFKGVLLITTVFRILYLMAT